MGKSIQKVMTRGVQDLGLPASVIGNLYRKAEELLSKSEFISFEPKGDQVVISDGNGKELGTTREQLPTKIWIIFDDYGDRWVATALLPSEY